MVSTPVAVGAFGRAFDEDMEDSCERGPRLAGMEEILGLFSAPTARSQLCREARGGSSGEKNCHLKIKINRRVPAGSKNCCPTQVSLSGFKLRRALPRPP